MTVVQVAEKVAGRARIIKHVGSAHDEAELAALVEVAKDFIEGDQLRLDLDLGHSRATGQVVVDRQVSRLLWQVLDHAWHDYGFVKVIPDEARRSSNWCWPG